MTKSRVSVAQKVVATARRLNQEQGNVQALPTTRLERGSADGKPTLMAVFPMSGSGDPHRLDLSFLLDFPLLAGIFAEGMLQWGKSVGPKSRRSNCDCLRRYWFAHLSERCLRDIPPERLDEQVMAGFTAWLHRKRQKNGQPLNPNTIRQALGALRAVLAHAPDAGKWLDLVPSGPRGAHLKTEPTEVLQLDLLLQVMAAAEEEVLALRDRWEKGQRLLRQGHSLLEQGTLLERNPRHNPKSRLEPNVALALAMLDERYPGVIPDLAVIKAHDASLCATIQSALGQTNTTSYLYGSGRNLVPLALCIGFATVFNPDTVLGLTWKDIDRTVDRLGTGAVQFDVREDDYEKDEKAEAVESDEPTETPLVRIIGDKPRARRQLVRLLDPEASGPTQVSLNLVLDLLTALTARIRPHAIAPEYRDCVFLFVQKNRKKRVKGFGSSTQSRSCDVVWKHALTDFIADHKLPDFSLKALRATLLDFVQLFNRGDLESAQQVGNHVSRVTTWTHYTSDLVKRLLQEATGETLLVRERWLDSRGKLDPRRHREWTNKGCATPGWMCLDPYESPRPNQRKDRLCTAYGECPDCPLAAARPENPRNVMLYVALRRAIYRSVGRVTPPVWQKRWAPVVVALDALLAGVQPVVLERSRSLHVELPDVG
jgi:Phage integrase SAM-like domain